MRWSRRRNFAHAAVLLTTLGAPLPALGAALPAATIQDLKIANLPAGVMDGLDQELVVPEPWLDGAKKEGTVKVIGEWDQRQFAIVNAPFAERYPQIKVIYGVAKSMNERAVAPLVAFKEGQYLTDVVIGFGGAAPDFKAANALENVTDLPGFKNQVEGSNDPDGEWAALRLRYWCIGYNKTYIAKDALPKTWDDLPNSAAFRDGNLGIGNRPQLWLLPLMTEKGKAWTEQYAKTFFAMLKPQFRDEGMDALVDLLAAGEIRASLPTAGYNVKELADKGAPVGWYCPDPVPAAPSQLGILKGNPHPNAARVWTNWMLSREAQLAQFVADDSPPSNKALQRKEFLAYPDQVVGRHLVQADMRLNRDMFAIWNKYWER